MALLGLLAVAVMVFAYVLTSRLNAASQFVGIDRDSNAKVLVQAKRALIGWMAINAATDNNPGRLPCPEHPWYIGNDDKEGIAGPSVGVPNPGVGAPTQDCTTIGRLPWRTLGLGRLTDSASEPLWYTVSPGWALLSSSTLLSINSDRRGNMMVDGLAAPNEVVALIFAPGPAMNVQTAAGCTARVQARAAPTPAIDSLDYIECFNAATPAFSTTGPATSFNDQVVRITVADLMPTLEAVIADRIQREIVPALNTVYTPAAWGFTGSNPIYPYPATFTNPGPGSGTSQYRGVAGLYRGLMPFNQTQGCTESPSNPRCTTSPGSFLTFAKSGNDVKTGGSGSIRTQSICSWSSDEFVCTGEYEEPSISVTVRVRVTNVAMGFRTFDPTKVSFTAMNNVAGGWPTQSVPHTETVVLNSDGSATITVTTTSLLPDIDDAGWGTYANYIVTIDRAAIGDHALLNSTGATTGWFVRNEWYRLMYYSVARGLSADVLASAPAVPACPTSTSASPPYTFSSNCLTVANIAPANNKRALLILAGRNVNGTVRPTQFPSDYLEFGNASGNFERQTITSGPAGSHVDTGSADAYAISVSSLSTGMPLQFRAQDTNTGASTLTTPVTGSKSLVNTDGSPLTAGTIQANAFVQVFYDGSQFILTKRPFNDRVIIIGSN